MGQNMGQIVRQQNFQRSPNLISICVDEIRNGELSGRLYHCYSEEACPFSNVAHLIELAENLFDQIKFPQASTQMRTFTEKSQKTVQPPEKKKSAEEPDELAQAVEKVLSDQTIVPQVVKFIRQYKTKQGINNALNKEFKDSKRTSEIYSAIKPLIADKKGK